MSGARQAGLRLQIVVALAALMLLAFVPLFFAVASLARATVLGGREQSARALGRAIAAHVADAYNSGRPGAIEQAVSVHAGRDGVDAICAFARGGSRVVCAGSPVVTEVLAAPADSGETVTLVRGAGGRAIEFASPAGGVSVVLRTHVEDGAGPGTALVQLVALYMITFALALLVFAYFALTRLIVRPIEQLAEAADRVAGGARSLRVPRRGASELADLGASMQTMAERLMAEEARLVLKVEELTEMTRRNAEAQAQIIRSERMASVGRLAAGVAHEIGNPIAALVGMEELLLDGDLPADQQRDFLQRMRRETDRIHTVIRDLLDFARPEGPAASSGAPSPADVRGVVADVVALVKPQKHFRNVKLDVDVDGVPPVGLAAPRLTQVLLNLVLNAGASVANGKPDGGRVTVRARREGQQVRVEVEDDGPGVDPSVRDRLFEPFVTTKEVGEGTGLGLAVCRGLVESVGGQVYLDASYTAGARFLVVLPVATA